MRYFRSAKGSLATVPLAYPKADPQILSQTENLRKKFELAFNQAILETESTIATENIMAKIQNHTSSSTTTTKTASESTAKTIALQQGLPNGLTQCLSLTLPHGQDIVQHIQKTQRILYSFPRNHWAYYFYRMLSGDELQQKFSEECRLDEIDPNTGLNKHIPFGDITVNEPQPGTIIAWALKIWADNKYAPYRKQHNLNDAYLWFSTGGQTVHSDPTPFNDKYLSMLDAAGITNHRKFATPELETYFSIHYRSMLPSKYQVPLGQYMKRWHETFTNDNEPIPSFLALTMAMEWTTSVFKDLTRPANDSYYQNNQRHQERSC